MPPWLQIVSPIITTIGVIAVAWLTKRAQAQAKSIEATAAPYDKLAARVTGLEAQVETLMRDLHEARTYTRVLIAERPPGMPLPQPIPTYIHSVYSTPATIITPSEES